MNKKKKIHHQQKPKTPNQHLPVSLNVPLRLHSSSRKLGKKNECKKSEKTEKKNLCSV